jgi:hypothetical protein
MAFDPEKWDAMVVPAESIVESVRCPSLSCNPKPQGWRRRDSSAHYVSGCVPPAIISSVEEDRTSDERVRPSPAVSRSPDEDDEI